MGVEVHEPVEPFSACEGSAEPIVLSEIAATHVSEQHAGSGVIALARHPHDSVNSGEVRSLRPAIGQSLRRWTLSIPIRSRAAMTLGQLRWRRMLLVLLGYHPFGQVRAPTAPRCRREPDMGDNRSTVSARSLAASRWDPRLVGCGPCHDEVVCLVQRPGVWRDQYPLDIKPYRNYVV